MTKSAAGQKPAGYFSKAKQWMTGDADGSKASPTRGAEAGGGAAHGGGGEDSGGGGLAPMDEEVRELTLEAISSSVILSQAQIGAIHEALPFTERYYSWRLAYSTSLHGSSINSFWRKVQEMEAGPHGKGIGSSLLVVQDTSLDVFGGFSAANWRKKHFFYGSGKSFLWRFPPGQSQPPHLPPALRIPRMVLVVLFGRFGVRRGRGGGPAAD